MQDCQYVLSHLLPECNLLVQGPKITYNTVCQDGFKLNCGVLRWISFILNSLIRDNFIFSTPNICNLILLFFTQSLKLDTFVFLAQFVKWYPCFLKSIQRKICSFFLLEKNEIMLLTYEKNGRGMILFHSRGKFSFHR